MANGEPSASASSQSPTSITNHSSNDALIEVPQNVLCASPPPFSNEPMLLDNSYQSTSTVQQSSSLTPLSKHMEDITNERKRAGDSQLSQA